MLCSISADKLTFRAALKKFIPSSLMLLTNRRRDSPILSSDYKVILTSSCYQKIPRNTGRHFDLPHSATNDARTHAHTVLSHASLKIYTDARINNPLLLTYSKHSRSPLYCTVTHLYEQLASYAIQINVLFLGGLKKLLIFLFHNLKHWNLWERETVISMLPNERSLKVPLA
jgi:hypothetical protein